MLQNTDKKLLWARTVLCVLIVLNMAVIYLFSSQSGEQSSQTSSQVTQTVATVVVKDFEEKDIPEQQKIVEQLHTPVRKIAHMAEFGSLGLLAFLLLLTVRKWNCFAKYGISLLYTFLYACTDELHQVFSDSRGPQFTDVLIDTSGAVLLCTLALAVVLLVQVQRHRREKNNEVHHLPTEETAV